MSRFEDTGQSRFQKVISIHGIIITLTSTRLNRLVNVLTLRNEVSLQLSSLKVLINECSLSFETAMLKFKCSDRFYSLDVE